MASPVHAGTLLPLLPTSNKTLCEIIQPGIIDFMSEVSRGYAWEFKVNGAFSDEFRDMVRALDCVGGGVILPCPVVALAGTATPNGSTNLNLSFNGTRMVADYDYNIYRSTTENTFIDPPIITGVTAGSVIAYADTGLTNGVEYFYRLTVNKSGCGDTYEVDISGTPQLCYDLLLTLSVVSPGANTARITVAGNLLGTYAYTIYASNLPNQIGSPISTGLVSDSYVTLNGAMALQYDHVAPPTGVPGGGATWFYTVQIQEDPACTLYEMTQETYVNDAALETPVLRFSDLAFRWGNVPGAARYTVYARATGACRTDAAFALVGNTTALLYSFDFSKFPCTENFDGTYCQSKWEVKILAHGTNGITSAYSNVANTPDFIKLPGQCSG